MSKRNRIPKTIYVDQRQEEGLRALSEATRISVSVFVREGLDLVLRKYSHIVAVDGVDPNIWNAFLERLCAAGYTEGASGRGTGER